MRYKLIDRSSSHFSQEEGGGWKKCLQTRTHYFSSTYLCCKDELSLSPSLCSCSSLLIDRPPHHHHL